MVLVLCLILTLFTGCGEGGADAALQLFGDLYEITSSHAVQAPSSVWWYGHRREFWHGAFEGGAVLDLPSNGFSLHDLSFPGIYSEPVVESAGLGRTRSLTVLLGADGVPCNGALFDFRMELDPDLPGYEHDALYPGAVPGNLFRQAGFMPGGSQERCLATAYAWEAGLGPCFDDVRESLASGGSGLWRMTAVYDGFALMPDGFLVEFQSMDGSFSFCRYIYNVQPGIEFDYATGRNWLEAAGDPEAGQDLSGCDGQESEDDFGSPDGR